MRSFCASAQVNAIKQVVESSNKVLIVTHKNADPDALASATILARFISTVFKRPAYPVYPEGLNEVSKKVAGRLNINEIYGPEVALSTSIKDECSLIIVDTSSSEQLGVLKDLVNICEPSMLIDHHVAGDIRDLVDHFITDPSSRSTSEIIYKIVKDLYDLTAEEAMLLLAGIIYDTRRFMIATPSTFHVASELINIDGVDYRSVLEMLQTEMDISERIARLKAAQRLSFKRINDILIAYTLVSAFEGSAARALLDLGADIAVVGSENDETRIVARARPSIVRELGISLGRDIMPAVGKYLRGSGGGHDMAAAATGKGDVFKALNYTVHLIMKVIGEKLRKKY